MRMLDELSLALARSRGQAQLEDGRLRVATTPLTAFYAHAGGDRALRGAITGNKDLVAR